ncbi:hypothetical protein NEUTE1DRAFT_116068 [Neurospora tetrasperma FGSC 2508]|uniref:Uncharacterized protein n=1 Tax=Neurospora tetrasperma (strain FGSC 2508 / ATCC MYA-4615 / P0657) TaxID=510951 RepID=F8MCS5_NEUT8|nr:uncharacterized protein NEUTE1DRAFT_116068 [Neurospora tetrasperma FGSC 2508]EGO61323.1 hypothetical protein NEUTE1DRAFT_116068 [Neurospora tetrasperma FGSC 2508]EGZ74663.1 hypothetical protein NEUTE2DRAFT_143416 [Neurospora tetrasperma FGSC 2509]
MMAFAQEFLDIPYKPALSGKRGHDIQIQHRQTVWEWYLRKIHTTRTCMTPRETPLKESIFSQ